MTVHKSRHGWEEGFGKNIKSRHDKWRNVQDEGLFEKKKGESGTPIDFWKTLENFWHNWVTHSGVDRLRVVALGNTRCSQRGSYSLVKAHAVEFDTMGQIATFPLFLQRTGQNIPLHLPPPVTNSGQNTFFETTWCPCDSWIVPNLSWTVLILNCSVKNQKKQTSLECINFHNRNF